MIEKLIQLIITFKDKIMYSIYILSFSLSIMIKTYIFSKNLTIKRKNIDKYHICIVMWYNKQISSYGNLAYTINKKYCQLNGYDIIKDSIRRLPDRPPHHERMPLILKYIELYDYIVWIDADAHFYIDSPPIENIIRNNNDKDFIFSKDWKSIFKYEINTGILIVKNSPYSISIIKKWCYNKILLKNRLGFNDQGIVRLYYYKNIDNIRNHSSVLPYGVLQSFKKIKKNIENPSSIFVFIILATTLFNSIYCYTDSHKYILNMFDIYVYIFSICYIVLNNMEKLSYPILLLKYKSHKPYIMHYPNESIYNRVKFFKKYIKEI